MPRVVQICASQNDLFALDDGGHVYRYNFITNRWVELAKGSRPDGQPQSAADASDGAAEPRVGNREP